MENNYGRGYNGAPQQRGLSPDVYRSFVQQLVPDHKVVALDPEADVTYEVEVELEMLIDQANISPRAAYALYVHSMYPITPGDLIASRKLQAATNWYRSQRIAS